MFALAAALLAASHPSLFFNAADVPALRQAAQTTHAEIANHITAILNQHLGDVPSTTEYDDFRFLGNQVAVWAFGYQITGNTQYAAKALSEIKTYLGWSDWGNGEAVDLGGPDLNEAHMMLGVAIAYDWIYETLSAADRTAIATRLGQEGALVAAYEPGSWYVDEYLQNHNWIDTAGLGIVGLVLSGDDARAAGWVATAQANLSLLQQYIGAIPDGVWHEGLPYEGYGLSMSLPFWQALKHQGSDYTDMGLLRGYGKFFTYASIPDSPRQLILPFGDFTNWPIESALQILRFSAGRFGDGVAEAMARRYLTTGRGSFLPELWYNVFEFLSYDPSVQPVDIHSHPLDGYFPDMGIAALHTQWDAGDFVLGFKAGVYGGALNFARVQTNGAWVNGPGGWIEWGHDHNDDMTFWLFGGGAWLAPEAIGYDAGNNTGYPAAQRANQTVFHNGILVDGTGQLGDARASDSNWNNPWFFNRVSSVLFAPTGTADYAIAGGKGPGLFDPALGITRWDRLTVMARGRYALVRDDIQASASHNYDWMCHFQDGVTIDTASGWVQGLGKNGMSLGVRVVSPASWTATTGSQTASLMSNFDPDGSTSFVKVRASAASANQQFLTALVPVKTASWASRVAVSALDASNAGSGLVVAPGSALEERWIFARTGSAAQSAGDLALAGPIAGMVAHDASGSVVRSALFGAGSVSDQGGARAVLSTRSAPALEANLVGTTLVVTGQNVADFAAYAPSAAAVTLNGVTVSTSSAGGVVTYPAAVVQAPPDAGTTPPPDAGSPTPDAGSAPVDGGAADAGDPGNGCGNCLPDAGTVAPDAGSNDAGTATGSADAGDPTGLKGPPVVQASVASGCSSSGAVAGWLALFALASLVWRRSRRKPV
ncbi:MAG TPA: heparinase II/III family protein [Myxococcales bacterium]